MARSDAKRTTELKTIVFIFFPPLPHARELEGWPDDKITQACELRRSPGLAVDWLARNASRCGAFPRHRQKFQRVAAVAGTELNPPYSRASATAYPSKSRFAQAQPRGLPRLPVHEVRDGCEGHIGPLRVTMSREKSAGKGERVSTR